MTEQLHRRDWLFLSACLGLGILAEASFLHGRIGVSYLVFIAGFYTVFFLKFKLSFNHRRIGILLMVAIWILSGNFLLYDNDFFHMFNLFIIPLLVLSHIILITSPNTFQWDTPMFAGRLINQLKRGSQYSLIFIHKVFGGIFKNMNEQRAYTLKRILWGLAIGLPLLLMITGLLMSADTMFEMMILRLPIFFLEVNFLEGAFRFLFVFVAGLLFFGVFQVLLNHEQLAKDTRQRVPGKIRLDSITAITILVLINTVYLLFTAIQFKYFFNGVLMEGFTYAEYARRGFAELLFVMLINWSILMSFLKLVHNDRQNLKLALNILYSLLIVMSGIMLASAYQRLSMYEAAYGFTFDRLLAHAFMIFLMIIFAYTLIRVWIERLSVTHFYLIMGLSFYTVLNAVNVDQMIVDQNIDRYKQTGKIDIYYLSTLSYTGWEGLLHLYESGQGDHSLTEMLAMKQEIASREKEGGWQSFNFVRQRVVEKFSELDLRGDLIE